MKKYVVTNIKYSIDFQDITDYLETDEFSDIEEENAREEIAETLPSYLIVEVEDEEELADAISDETGWCVESFNSNLIVDFITSECNLFLEKDFKYWIKEFGCDKTDLIDHYGFGYTQLNKLYFLSVDEVTEITMDRETLVKEILDNRDSVMKMRGILKKIFEENK